MCSDNKIYTIKNNTNELMYYQWLNIKGIKPKDLTEQVCISLFFWSAESNPKHICIPSY